MNVFVPSMGKVSLSNKDFIAKGGQAAIYRKSNRAFKVYHDPKDMIPTAKVKELEAIANTNVLKPLASIFNDKKKPIGYVMDFVNGGVPLCKLFTRSFKDQNGVSPNDVADLVTEMQKVVMDVHGSHCLIVDLNEFNLMLVDKLKRPIFLDVDSYQTPSFPATALMESIRDPLVKSGKFTVLSDWYSFSILAFQLYIGIHPFRGSHPAFAKNAWRERMDKNVSVFDPDARMPRSCYDLNVIPLQHLDWFKSIYVNGDRSEPPILGAVAPIVVASKAIRIIRKSAMFELIEKLRHTDDIIDVYSEFGTTVLLAKDGLWHNGRKIESRTDPKEKMHAVIIDGDVVAVRFDGSHVSFSSKSGSKSDPAAKIMFKENRIYSFYIDAMWEHRVMKLGGKHAYSKTKVTDVIPGQTRVYDGVVMQEAINRTIVTIPYDEGKHFTKVIPELDDYRIISARCERNVMVVIGEKDGMLHRLVFVFSQSFASYTLRIHHDVRSSDINFTVLPSNGMCILLVDDDKIEVFLDNSKVREVDNPPFDSATKLFSTVDGVHFIDGRSVMKASMRK